MNNRSRGFTITELMVTLTIAGIILAIGAPTFRDFRRNNRLTSASNDLLATIQVGRTEAIKRQQSVSICPTATPNDPAAICAGAAFRGWMAFVDLNNDCDRSAGEALIKEDGPVDTTVSTRSNGVCISFAPTGFLQTIPGVLSATQTLYCDSRGLVAQAGTTQSAGRGVFVTLTGRSRVSRDITSNTATDLDTWGLVCP